MNIYFKTGDEYYRYYKLELRKNGFYLVDNSQRGNHFSYHTDGTCFYHYFGTRNTKKIRRPLSEFTGIESLSCVNILLLDATTLETKRPQIKAEDFIIERQAPFCFELILSEKPFELPDLPTRINSKSHQKKLGHIYVTVEVFENASNYLMDTRYNPNKWVVGENFFMFFDGKWQ